ncbi:MAG TPA: prepilin peptidase [Lachnospiraceae bacterium]|nr:prepilin peptidase [Lachnospiraceae bacterium]
MTTFQYITIFLYGIIIGSFLNVCIYRIPRKENIVTTPSHCMNCGYQLKWYDLLPLLSFIQIKGRCRSCKTKLSLQYPLVELCNGVLYIIIFLANGFHIESVLYCLATSTLLVISFIDFKTFEIPPMCNLIIGVLGIIELGLHIGDWKLYIIGFFAVSTFLLLIFWITKGRGIGGGDIKLMAAAGLLLGWKLVIVAFLWGCILGSIIHILRMKISREENVLAFGPYLSMGVFLAMIYGEQFIDWYLRLCMIR